MAKLFKVDVSALSTHEGRYKIVELFKPSFEVYEHWVTLNLLQHTLYDFEAFWAYDTPPPLPQLPDCVRITEI